MHRTSSFVLVILRSLALTVALLLPVGTYAQDETLLRSSRDGEVRGLIIGIDAYRYVRPLKGAVADARDIEAALRRMGTKDVTTLIDDQADRDSIIKAIGQLVNRTSPNDLILLSIAGHGAQEPERIKGSEPDGMENVFLLPQFQATAAGSQQRILGREFNHFIRQLELRGASVMFVADTCHGGGMARDIDPRAAEMSFRQVPTYTLPTDMLKPVTTAADNTLTELDLDHTAFLAAVDRKTKAPEVKIPGFATLRGALSYAVARAIEGGADADHDGKVTLKELFTNVRQVVYQLSDQRQNIVTMTAPSRDLSTEVAFKTRGIRILDAPKDAVNTLEAGRTPSAAPSPQILPQVVRTERPVRIAALDGKADRLTGLVQRETPFEVVQPVDNPDLIWDPGSRDVIAWGDVVAYRVEKDDLSSVIDRAAAVRDLKQISTKSPQVIRVSPDDSRHKNESTVQIEVSNVAGRSLLMFNIAGDGTVQLLYPLGRDASLIADNDFRFPVRVREPFGADQIIAITSQQRMPQLEQALMQLNRRRAAGQMIRMVQRFAPQDARIGSTGLFTGP